MSKNKNRKKKMRRASSNRPGTQAIIKGQLQSITFDISCFNCKKLLDHVSVRVPKPSGWTWDKDQLAFEVYHCCDKQECVELALNELRKGLQEGIVVAGTPPKNLFS